MYQSTYVRTYVKGVILIYAYNYTHYKLEKTVTNLAETIHYKNYVVSIVAAQ